MNQIKVNESKFWAGGSREFHRASRERNMDKGPLGWFNKILRRISEFMIGPIIRDIDERLFIKKQKK